MEHRRERLSATGRTSVSLCRWEKKAILWDPLAVLSAAFCNIYSLAMDEGDELGNQMGAAYVNKDLMRDLKVMMIVSSCWPQDVPTRDLRMFSLERARSQTAPMCGEKV